MKTKTRTVGKEKTKVDVVTSGELKGFIMFDPNWSKQDIKNVFSD